MMTNSVISKHKYMPQLSFCILFNESGALNRAIIYIYIYIYTSDNNDIYVQFDQASTTIVRTNFTKQ